MRKSAKRAVVVALVLRGTLLLPLVAGGLTNGIPSGANVLIQTTGQASDVQAGEASAVAKFKGFLSAPPVVECLVFSEQLPPDAAAPWRTDVPLESSRALRYWLARWQPEAYLLREITSLDALYESRTPGLLAVRFGDECWFHYGRGYHNEVVQFAVGTENNVRVAADLNSDILRQVLAFGLMRTQLGSVEWHGTKFDVARPERGFNINGELVSVEHGLPREMLVTYSRNGEALNWKIRYDYGGNASLDLPSMIRCLRVDEGVEIERQRFVIYALETRNVPLGREAFRPDSLLTSNHWHTLVYTNRSIYEAVTGGKLRLVGADSGRPSQGIASGHLTRAQGGVLYLMWAGANASILLLSIRMSLDKRRRNKTNERKETKET